MTAAYRLRGGGWLLATVAIVLGFYLVSLRVAEERKRLEAVNARIASAQRDIRALETEFDTRANLVQLERWNGDTLALAAPSAGQFVHDEAQLAALNVGDATVRAASLVVPAIAAPAAVLPQLASAAPAGAVPAAVHPVVPAAPVRVALIDPAARGLARVTKAPALSAPGLPARAMARIAPARDLARIANAERAHEAVARVRPQAVAMLDDKLLSDATLGDLIAKARREARRR